jgi:hypothetical protein
LGEATDDSFGIIEWSINQGIITPEQALTFIARNIEVVGSYTEIQALSSLLSVIPETTTGYGVLFESVKKHIIEVVSDNFSEFIDVDSAFSSVDYGDVNAACDLLEKFIERELLDLGVDFFPADVRSILKSYDVESELYNYFISRCEEVDKRPEEGPAALAIDEIDELFDRG